MNTFADAVALVIQLEGPDTNDPNDPGGLTRFGIAQNEHPNIDVATLTLSGAVDIYKKEYWDVNNLDNIPYFLALPTFDCAVNQGAKTAAIWLQRALNTTPDGIIGPTTQAIAKIASRAVLDKFMTTRVLAYTRDAQFPIYGEGWLARCFHISRAAIGG